MLITLLLSSSTHTQVTYTRLLPIYEVAKKNLSEASATFRNDK